MKFFEHDNDLSKREMKKREVLREIKIERDRQDQKWGGPEHDDGHHEHDWVAYIIRHLGRAVVWPRDLPAFRAAMVKVGALAVAAIEWADRRVTGARDE